MREAGAYTGQSSLDHSAAAGTRLENTEHAGQNGQECCQVGLQQNLLYFFECLIICTGAALHTHTCCIYFSVWSYKYLQVRYWRDTHAEAWIWSSTSVLAAWFTQWTSAESVGSISTSCTHFRIKTKEKSILVTALNRMSWHRTKICVWDSHHYLTVLHIIYKIRMKVISDKNDHIN